jgi:hypothetical protein
MKGRGGMLCRLTIALSIFPALAFGREIAVQGRDERIVLRIERDWLRALVERDRATLDRILADDFIDSSWKGELRNKWQVLAGLSRPLPYWQRLQDVRIKLYQDVAVARGLNMISDQNGRIMMRIRFTDVLLYRQGHWQAVAAQETPVNSR